MLPEKDKRDLEAALSEKELKDALSQAENEKTLGCDGIPYEFLAMISVKISMKQRTII